MLTSPTASGSGAGHTLGGAVEEAVLRYVERNSLSRAQHERARRVLPGGNTRSVLYFDPFPLTFKHAEGAYLYSLDGDRYVDFLGEFTAGIFGHSNPVILDRVNQVLERGISYGGHNPYEPELAAQLCERVPSYDLVRFTNSGTEANLMALATAVVHTQRRKIVVFEGAYHGGLLMFAGPAPLNVPHEFVVGQYNDTVGVRALLRQHRGEVAAVLVEPMMGAGGCIPAELDFLQMLREETTQDKSVLIFDEVMTSRLSAGGLQQLCGVTPDMTTLGKYIGGGMSIGAFGGCTEIMSRYDPARGGALQHAGTFNNNVLSMAAGATGLRELYTADAADRLTQRGEELRGDLNAIFVDAQVALQVTGCGSVMSFHATGATIKCWADLAHADRDVEALLFHHLLENGIWLAARGLISLSLPLVDDDHTRLVAATRAFVNRYDTLLEGNPRTDARCS